MEEDFFVVSRNERGHVSDGDKRDYQPLRARRGRTREVSRLANVACSFGLPLRMWVERDLGKEQDGECRQREGQHPN